MRWKSKSKLHQKLTTKGTVLERYEQRASFGALVTAISALEEVPLAQCEVSVTFGGEHRPSTFTENCILLNPADQENYNKIILRLIAMYKAHRFNFPGFTGVLIYSCSGERK